MTLSQEILAGKLKRPFRYLESVGSSNDAAKAWLMHGAPQAAAVIANAQTGGRGRLGRAWQSPPGASLALSIIFRPGPALLPRFSLLGALAAVDLAESLGCARLGIKWPNDVLADGKKISGILPEAVWQGETLAGLVLGIGVNVRVDFKATPLEQRATSLETVTGRQLDRAELLSSLLQRVDYWHDRIASPKLFSAWKSRLDTLGKRVARGWHSWAGAGCGRRWQPAFGYRRRTAEDDYGQRYLCAGRPRSVGMSRIRLQWRIESQRIDESAGEDPAARRERRRSLMRLLALIAILLTLLAVGIAFLRQRLLDVQAQLEAMLRDTVRAEVASLRIGDVNTFLGIQQGGNPDWLARQQARFRDYSDLKAAQDLRLTGNILDWTIEGERARVAIEEVINGVSTVQIWFYARDAAGWRHAPPDYGFWGEARQIKAQKTIVNYRAVDQSVATALSDRLSSWWGPGCDLLGCQDLPILQATIVTDAAGTIAWADSDRLHLILLSPFVGRALTESPFSPELQIATADRLAQRLLDHHSGDLRVEYPHDVVYLRQSAHTYLRDSFLGRVGGDSLLGSLAEAYGAGAVARLVERFSATADMSILASVLPEPIANAGLDWRDFIKWRLNLEAELLAAGDESAWLDLYDRADPAVLRLASGRYRQRHPQRVLQVLDQQILESQAGGAQLLMSVVFAGGVDAAAQTIQFNLVDQVWKRAS